MTLLLIALEYSTWSSLNDLKIKLYSGGIVPHFTFVIVGWSKKLLKRRAIKTRSL